MAKSVVKPAPPCQPLNADDNKIAKNGFAAVHHPAFNRRNGFTLPMRIGIHSGPVVAGVIGKSKFVYDLWGETVNTASRMESHGVAGRIQLTESGAQHLSAQFFPESRGRINIKGKRLGEILVEQGLVAQKHISRVLRKQKRMRMLALAVTVLVAPFQMARADDLSPSHDLYTATQQELIKTFEAQVTLGGNGGNEDAGDIAKVIQTGGEANLAIILQSGNHDVANIVQTGGIQNAALISQYGNDQIASISQSGNHTLALIAQR